MREGRSVRRQGKGVRGYIAIVALHPENIVEKFEEMGVGQEYRIEIPLERNERLCERRSLKRRGRV